LIFPSDRGKLVRMEKAAEEAVHPRPTGRPEAWHRLGAGSFIRDVVLGSSDGLVAVLAFVAGVSASLGARRTILLAGLAEMFAGAASMGLGAYLGTKSEREFYEKELAREKAEIVEMPHEEREEIRQIYRRKGFEGKELEMVVARITGDRERWLKVMMHEELGFPQKTHGSPLQAGAAMALAYVVGAAIPISPYFVFSGGRSALLASILCTLGALFAVGAWKSRLSRRVWWKAGLEMSLAGGAGALICYFIAQFVGALVQRWV
jgi:VIT1/CCC1 family predicted Fe2+/Mn2+ transporter